MQGAFEGLIGQLGGEAFVGAPAEDAAAAEVHLGGEIEPAFARRQVGDVGDPDFVGPGGRGTLQQVVGSHGRGLVGNGGAGHEAALLAHAEVLLAHEPGDAVLAVVQAFAAQAMHEARGAVGAAAGGEGCADLVGELCVLAAARALGLAQVGMVAAATDVEGLAGFGEVHARLFVVEGLDEGVALPSCWATMAKAFFKMSFWARMASSSRRREAISTAAATALELPAFASLALRAGWLSAAAPVP